MTTTFQRHLTHLLGLLLIVMTSAGVVLAQSDTESQKLLTLAKIAEVRADKQTERAEKVKYLKEAMKYYREILDKHLATPEALELERNSVIESISKRIAELEANFLEFSETFCPVTMLIDEHRELQKSASWTDSRGQHTFAFKLTASGSWYDNQTRYDYSATLDEKVVDTVANQPLHVLKLSLPSCYYQVYLKHTHANWYKIEVAVQSPVEAKHRDNKDPIQIEEQGIDIPVSSVFERSFDTLDGRASFKMQPIAFTGHVSTSTGGGLLTTTQFQDGPDIGGEVGRAVLELNGKTIRYWKQVYKNGRLGVSEKVGGVSIEASLVPNYQQVWSKKGDADVLTTMGTSHQVATLKSFSIESLVVKWTD